MTTNPKTRPSSFGWTHNFECERVYRITEDPSVCVLDAGGGSNPLTDRLRVRATVTSEADWRGRTLWVVVTKGFSSHGNSSTHRVFDSFDSAERHIKRWATRRWRVAL